MAIACLASPAHADGRKPVTNAIAGSGRPVDGAPTSGRRERGGVIAVSSRKCQAQGPACRTIQASTATGLAPDLFVAADDLRAIGGGRPLFASLCTCDRGRVQCPPGLSWSERFTAGAGQVRVGIANELKTVDFIVRYSPLQFRVRWSVTADAQLSATVPSQSDGILAFRDAPPQVSAICP